MDNDKIEARPYVCVDPTKIPMIGRLQWHDNKTPLRDPRKPPEYGDSSPWCPHVPRSNPTWRELAKLEPRLTQLYKEIKTIKDEGAGFCANVAWYCDHPRGLGPGMNQLVGWVSKTHNPRLRTIAAHGLVYDKLYGALPNCRNCGCA